jgi:hypothetical protein
MCRTRKGFMVGVVVGIVVVISLIVVVVLVVVVLVVCFGVVLVVCFGVRLIRSLDCPRGRGKASSSLDRVGKEVIELGGVNGVVVGKVKTVEGGGVGWSKIAVIFIGVDRVVGTPLNDEATRLYEGLAFESRKGFNARDGVFCHREKGPLVAGNAGAGRQEKEIIVPFGVTGGGQSNGAE